MLLDSNACHCRIQHWSAFPAIFGLRGACRLVLRRCRPVHRCLPDFQHIKRLTHIVNATDVEGGGTSKITDVWVSVDDRLIGVWELPARIPVLRSGSVLVSVTPGVKRNGSFDDRLRYPFYTSYNSTVDLLQEGTVELEPVVEYGRAIVFWMERFQDEGNQLTVTTTSDTTLLLYTAFEHPQVVLDGTSCGGFVLDQAHNGIRIHTTEDFTPTGGPTFVELDYSTDISLTVGMTFEQNGSTSFAPWVVLVPTTAEGGVKWRSTSTYRSSSTAVVYRAGTCTSMPCSQVAKAQGMCIWTTSN